MATIHVAGSESALFINSNSSAGEIDPALPVAAVSGKRLQRVTGLIMDAAVTVGALVGGPYFAIMEAPPAHIEASLIAGSTDTNGTNVAIEARAVVGRSVTALRAGVATFYLKKSQDVFGMHIAGDINVDLSNLKLFTSLDNFNYTKLQEVGQQLSQYEPVVEELTQEVSDYYKNRAELAEEIALGLLVCYFGIRKFGKFYHDNAPLEAQKYIRRAYVIAGLGTAAITIPMGASAYAGSHDFEIPHTPSVNQLVPDHIFDSVPGLKGTMIESQTQPIIDTLVGYIENYFQEADSIRKTIETNDTHENQRLYGTDHTPKGNDVYRMIDLDDAQGDWILASIETKIFHDDKGDFVAIPGDATTAGSDPFVLYAVRVSVGKHTPIAAARSEHDSPETTAAERKLGFYVSSADPKNPADIGTVQNIGGRRVLIANYPERAPLGQQSYEIKPGVQVFIENLKKAICEQQPDIVIEHDSNTVGHSMEKLNCVAVLGHPAKNPDKTTIFIDGRSYKPQKSHVYKLDGYGKIIEVTAGSSGGLTATSGPSFLKPTNPGFETIIDHYNKLDITTVQIKTIYPDGSVTFSPEILTEPTPENLTKFQASGQSLRLGSDTLLPQQTPGHR
jgi:hypothetical protein